MLNIHEGQSIESSTVMKTGRINTSLVEEDQIESFYIGFLDRLNEEYDNIKYNRINRISTIRELFYLLGYKISDKEIGFSGSVRKNLPSLRDFRDTIFTYISRFDIVTFFERNTQETLQMLP
jgi:hypothetical protein